MVTDQSSLTPKRVLQRVMTLERPIVEREKTEQIGQKARRGLLCRP